MWFLVHVPGMNGANTRGLLGKGLSATVTPVVFGLFIPGTCICSHNYSIMYQKSNVREGNIGKSRALGGENSLTGGLFGALNGAGAWTGAGAEVEKKNAPPRAIGLGRAGN